MNDIDKCYDFTKIPKEPDADFDLKKQIYHILMPFKVRDILIVSSLYDAFVIEEEGLISELVIGQYHHHLLSSPPRITRVTTGSEALTQIKSCHYDLVITMSKNIGMDPFNFGKKIKKLNPDIPVVLLATDPADIEQIHKIAEYVNEKLREIKNNTEDLSEKKTAILAALNIASEYLLSMATSERNT